MLKALTGACVEQSLNLLLLRPPLYVNGIAVTDTNWCFCLFLIFLKLLQLSKVTD